MAVRIGWAGTKVAATVAAIAAAIAAAGDCCFCCCCCCRDVVCVNDETSSPLDAAGEVLAP